MQAVVAKQQKRRPTPMKQLMLEDSHPEVEGFIDEGTTRHHQVQRLKARGRIQVYRTSRRATMSRSHKQKQEPVRSHRKQFFRGLRPPWNCTVGHSLT